MSNFQRSGVPQTLNVTADSDGKCLRFKQWSSAIVVQADAPVTLYWTLEDFQGDKNGLLISGEQPRIPQRLDVAVANVWLRGQGASSQVSVTVIGKDG